MFSAQSTVISSNSMLDSSNTEALSALTCPDGLGKTPTIHRRSVGIPVVPSSSSPLNSRSTSYESARSFFQRSFKRRSTLFRKVLPKFGTSRGLTFRRYRPKQATLLRKQSFTNPTCLASKPIAKPCTVQDPPFMVAQVGLSNGSDIGSGFDSGSSALHHFHALDDDQAYFDSLQGHMSSSVNHGATSENQFEITRVSYYKVCQLLTSKKRQVSYLSTQVDGYLDQIREQNCMILAQKQQIAELKNQKIDAVLTEEHSKYVNVVQQMDALFSADQSSVVIPNVFDIDTLFESESQGSPHSHAPGVTEPLSLLTSEFNSGGQSTVAMESGSDGQSTAGETPPCSLQQLQIENYERKISSMVVQLETREMVINLRRQEIKLLKSQVQALRETQIPTLGTDTLRNAVDEQSLKLQQQLKDVDSKIESITRREWTQLLAERDKYKNDYKEMLYLYNSLADDTEKLQRIANTDLSRFREREISSQLWLHEYKLEVDKRVQTLEAVRHNLTQRVDDLTLELELCKIEREPRKYFEKGEIDIGMTVGAIEDKLAAALTSPEESLNVDVRITQDQSQYTQYIKELRELACEEEARLHRVEELAKQSKDAKQEQRPMQYDLESVLHSFEDLERQLDESQQELADSNVELEIEKTRVKGLEMRVQKLVRLIEQANMRFDELSVDEHVL